MCRPIDIDGTCHNSVEWLCPGSETSEATSAMSMASDEAGILESGLNAFVGLVSGKDVRAGGLRDLLFLAFGCTLALGALYSCIRMMSQGRLRAERTGKRGAPVGSARRRAQHVVLSGRETVAPISQAEGDEEVEDGDGDEYCEDEILGDDAPALQMKQPLSQSRPRAPGGTALGERPSKLEAAGVTKSEGETDPNSEDALLKRVAELLKDQPLADRAAFHLHS